MMEVLARISFSHKNKSQVKSFEIRQNKNQRLMYIDYDGSGYLLDSHMTMFLNSTSLSQRHRMNFQDDLLVLKRLRWLYRKKKLWDVKEFYIKEETPN